MRKSTTVLSEEVKKCHEEKVYGRLVSIALACYEKSKTNLDFQDWMERQGLIMKNGFFIPVENYKPEY